MPLPRDFEDALRALAIAFEAYRRSTGAQAVLVGGAVAAIYTAGQFMSCDFDVVAADDTEFDAAMLSAGFVREQRPGRLLVGYHHPHHPAYGFQQVSGPLFNGASDPARIMLVAVTPDGAEIAMPSFEDMIADRLAQAAVASPTDPSRLLQARALFRLAPTLDMDYLRRRVAQEGGDLAALEEDRSRGPGKA
jgi:hypothetical protein